MLNSFRHLRLVLIVALALAPGVAAADLLQSSHFRLDPSVADSFGGTSGSGSYRLSDSGGEAAIGSGSSQSYHLGQGYTSQLSHSLQLSVLPSGTYAYWPFDTNSGTVAYDVSLNNDDATLVNNPAWTTGMVGSGVTLNGSTQYITTRNLVSAPTIFTLEFWFKSTSSSGGYLMGFGDAATGVSSTKDRVVYLTNAGNLAFGVKPGGYNVVTTQEAYNDGSWHYVAASFGAGGQLLYVDGVLRAANASSTSAGSYSGYWRLGYDDLSGWPSAPTNAYLAGSLDEARVTTRQLSAAEIGDDYTAGANALTQAFTLPNITPGQSQTYSVDAMVRTDAGGYDLYLQRPRPLTHTDGNTTIPDISGSITTPTAWTESVTKGFGFTITAGTQLEGKWGSGQSYNYAALPAAATAFHSRTGLTGGAAESTTIQYRADTLPQQKQGTYTTTVIYTATAKP